MAIEKGFTGDEIEKQLQEEEAKMSVDPETKETTENVAEKELNTKVVSLEKNAETVQKTVEEIGGTEVIKQVLSKMSSEERQILDGKIKNLKKEKEAASSRKKAYAAVAILMLGVAVGMGNAEPTNDIITTVGNTISIEKQEVIQLVMESLTFLGGVGAGIASAVNAIKERINRKKMEKLEKQSA